MARGKLPIFPRYAADGRLLGYQVKIRRTGQPHIAKQFDTLADAEKFAVNILSEMSRGQFSDRREVDSLPLADAIDRYDREVGPTKKRPDGVTAYARRWKEQPLAQRMVGSLRPSDFAKYRDVRLTEGLAGNSVRLELGFIRHLFTIGIKEWGWPVTNPVESIRMPKCAPGRDRRLQDGEESRLFAAIAKTATRNDYLAPIVRLALETGARQGELRSLQWQHVDFDDCTAHIPDTKTGVARTLPLSPAAFEVLWSLGAEIDPEARSGLIFSVGQMAVVHAFERAVKRAGIEDLRFHDLRHEAVSRLFERGLDLMEVAAVSGHKSLQMLKRYTHLRAADLAKKLG